MRRFWCVLMMVCGLAGSSLAVAQLVYDGLIVDRANRYDGYPTHLYLNGLHNMWFCGQSPITGADAIYYTTNTDLRNTSGWTTPQEVLAHPGVPWAPNHICDPSVVAGEFTYNSTAYSLALYFTADVNGVGMDGDNAAGVAFSNDGVNWAVHPTAIITPDGGFDGTYGAGAGASAWSTDPTRLHHVYRDSTTGAGSFRVRYKESTDGVVFSPTPSLDTMLSDASSTSN